ncbi:MAG: hypothetical protein WEC39_00455 [Patescibacteria group bacterium]
MERTKRSSFGIELLPALPSVGRAGALTFWARAVGIPLILILQLISLSVLAFRFKVEGDLKDLSASVAQKEAVLAQSQELENFLLDTQARLNLVKQVNATLCYSCSLTAVSALAPASVKINSFILENEQIELSAQAARGSGFATFVANILGEKIIKEAAITSGGLDRTGNFIFAMELALDPAQAPKREK